MVAFRYSNVCIESFGTFFSSETLTSTEIEERLAPLYQRLGIPFGTLERLSGIRSRKVWGREMAPSAAATEAAQACLESTSFDKSKIKLLLSCSVCRDVFEPATAALVHRNLRLHESVNAFDITNACIGFSNGLMMAAQMIESGALDAALVVSGENPRIILDSNFAHFKKHEESITRDDLLKVLPTFTLGCGAVAYLLCHEKYSTHKRKRFVGAVAHTASEFADLCVGNGDFCVMEDREEMPLMHTESNKLITAAAQLGGRAWRECSELVGWSSQEVDHVFCHQVGKQVNDAFYKQLGLEYKKEFIIYPEYGNMISAALPSAIVLGSAEKGIKEGEKVVCTAFGSGLNSIFYGIEW